jgi:hypothetical protein
MPMQRSIWLVHRKSDLFAGGVIGLHDVQSYYSIGMAGQNLRRGFTRLRCVGQQSKFEPLLGSLRFGPQRQPEPKQSKEQAAIGGRYSGPFRNISRDLQIRNHTGEPATQTIGILVRIRHEPIANVMRGIVQAWAKPGLPRNCKRFAFAIAHANHRREDKMGWHKAQLPLARNTFGIFEVKRVAT